ncbi:MAG: AMP-binding protein [Eudoraea sp.]|nr:AMP-binding protein [Eudoraea sp.]NNJ40151.1 AMP-binding protein [Eudoraea sp.]
MNTEIAPLHHAFRLNGMQYNYEDLKEVAYSLIKEGEPFERRIGDFLLDWLSDEDTILVTTSGATGVPKRIFLKKEHMVNSARATGEVLSLREGNSALLCLPADYIAGKMMLVRAMVLGLEIDFVEPSSEPLWRTIDPYDLMAMVPMQVQNSLKKLDLFGTILIGGAPVSGTLHDALQQTTARVFETYGMTETCSHVALKALNPAAGAVEGAVGNAFKALPGITFSKNAKGCLVLQAPEVTREPLETNDLVELLNDKEFIWLGRYDNVVNSGGVKLMPETIEEKLKHVINETFILGGIPDAELGECLVMVVEARELPKDLEKKLQALKTLEKYEFPKHIFVREKFPKTENGKIKRKELLDLVVSDSGAA